MTIKEKLIDLLTDNLPRCGNLPHWDNPLQLSCDEQVERIADHLIAHGVTVQEWVSVAEHPKEYRDEYGELIPFLVCEEGTDYPFRAMYDGKTWGDGIFAIPVKWWMHLPAPPKEKERKDGDGNV